MHSASTKKTAPGFLPAFVRHFDFLEGQWEEDQTKLLAQTQDEALLEIYKRVRPGEPPSVESARNYFRSAFFESRRYDLSRVGRYKLNRKSSVQKSSASKKPSASSSKAPTWISQY